MPKITWPDITFGPINLWTMPKQMSDYMIDEKRREAANKRADSLRLTPRKKPGVNSKICIPPTADDAVKLSYERMRRCIEWRNGVN